MNRGTLRDVLLNAEEYSPDLTIADIALMLRNGATLETYVEHQEQQHDDVELSMSDSLAINKRMNERLDRAFYIYYTEIGRTIYMIRNGEAIKITHSRGEHAALAIQDMTDGN